MVQVISQEIFKRRINLSLNTKIHVFQGTKTLYNDLKYGNSGYLVQTLNPTIENIYLHYLGKQKQINYN